MSIGPVRPGSVTGAAVLGYIEAALLFLGGLFLIISAWRESAWIAQFFGSGSGPTFTYIGVFVIVIAALYIPAASQLQGGKGRALLIALTSFTIVGLLFSAFATNLPPAPGLAMLGGLVPPVVALVMSLQSSTTRWIAEQSGAAAQ